MKYYVICDYRENFKNYSLSPLNLYSDHPTRKNITEIIEALHELGYDCEFFGGIPELIHAVDQNYTFESCVFLNFTDGMEQDYSRVQAPVLLDILDVPYSGSNVMATVLMNNKYFCKQALLDHEIPMPQGRIINSIMKLNMEDLYSWKYPLFIKPNCEGSSLGISQNNVCCSEIELKERIKELSSEFEEIIVEEYVGNLDVTNYLIGNEGNYLINDIVVAALPGTLKFPVYGISEKQNKLQTLSFNDEFLPSEIVRQIKDCSERIAKILGAKDICRIDYRYDKTTKKFYFIEANSAPRFSSTSEISYIAKKRGLLFKDMIQKYVTAFTSRIHN